MPINHNLRSTRRTFSLVALVLTTFHSPLVLAGPSGDPIIDGGIPSGYKYRAGGSGGGVNRGGNTVLCNAPGAHTKEQKCPNDATYTPSAATGGYQAWGIGLAPVTFGYRETECYMYLVPVWHPDDWYVEYVWETECEQHITILPAGTFGMAMAVVRWGEQVQSTTNQISTKPTSIVAFHENLIDPCYPYLVGSEAYCAPGGPRSFVEDSGYEIDIHMEDPVCNPIGGDRGWWDDYSADCFTYQQFDQTSTLPYAYQDTTFLDDARLLTIGFGSANGKAINPGTDYIVRQMFRSQLQPYMQNYKAWHTGGITSEFELAPICVANGGDPEWCFFGVDNASVGGAKDRIEYVP